MLKHLFIYSARTLGNSTHTFTFLSPTYLASHKSPRQGAVRPVLDTGSAYAFALRFLGYDKLPIDFNVYDSVLSTHISCCLCFVSFRILSNYFRVTVGTQAPDFSTPYLQRRIFPIRGHLILLNMLIRFFNSLRFR